MRAILVDGELYIPKIWESPGVYGDGYLLLEPSDPGYDEWLAEATHTVGDEEMTAAAWDESDHPRDPGGEEGGQFISKEATAEGPVMGLGPESRREQIEKLNDQNPMGLDDFGKARVEEVMADYLADAELQMRMPEAAFLEMLQDAEFHNQHQSGDFARGMPRDLKSEASMLGLSMETKPEDMPKYAYLGPETEYVTMYGPIKIVFKDDVKDRTTFAMGDTLMQNVMPSPVRDPWWGSAEGYIDLARGGISPDDWVSQLESQGGYMEGQIYGKLTPADIQRVEVLSEDYWEEEDPMAGTPLVDSREQMEATMRALEELKIPWSTYEPEGDFSGEWA